MAQIMVKEQVIALEKELEKVTQECEQLLEYVSNDKNNDSFSHHFEELNAVIDTMGTLQELEKARNKMKAIESLLKNAVVVETTSSDRIEVGSRFEADFGDGELEQYTLLENLSGMSSLEGYISVSSPFGNSVLGKKAGETFSYIINHAEISGMVVSVENQKAKQKTKA